MHSFEKAKAYSIHTHAETRAYSLFAPVCQMDINASLCILYAYCSMELTHRKTTFSKGHVCYYAVLKKL